MVSNLSKINFDLSLKLLEAAEVKRGQRGKMFHKKNVLEFKSQQIVIVKIVFKIS